MTDSKTLLLNENVYNQKKSEESFSTNSFNFDQNLDWDNYDFALEYSASIEEERRQNEELVTVDQLDSDEKSTPTILTFEDVDLEASEESEESSVYFCFREVDISDSQLKIPNVFNSFPVPKDPGTTENFFCIFHKAKEYEDSFKKYTDVCKKMKLRPINCLKEQFTKNECNLRYYGIDSRSFRAISEALFDNIFVNSLDLKDNWLTVDACFHLNELLLQNTFIVTLILSGCQIGAAGSKRIEEGLMSAPNLLNLNLSHCELGNEGLNNICSAIYLNESLKTLDLSDNHLNEKCAKNLEAIISKTQTLVQLNLAWNSLCDKETCKAIFNSLSDNSTMEEIDLSWNGIGSDCSTYISSFLSKSANLKVLNLCWNQFVDIDQISKALSKNSVLEKLYFGNNPLKSVGASNLIESLTLEKAPESKLRFLDMENVWVDKKILSALEMIENKKPWLHIKLGGILGDFKLIGPNEKQLLLKRANFEAGNTKKKKERKNFGHFVLSLEDNAIPFKKFADLVKNCKLKLSDNLVQAIGKAFTLGKNLVDQGEIKSVYLKEYPDTIPPPEKKKKKSKNTKKGKAKIRDKAKQSLKLKKEIKHKKKTLKSKQMIKKISMLSQEHESANILFEDFEDNFEF